MTNLAEYPRPMRLLATSLLLLILVSLNALLGTRLIMGGSPVPPLGHFLSPQEGFWRNAEPLGYKAPKELKLKRLSAAVEVVWDEHGVPHIFAANDSDLYRAQGYVVAQLRLWQLDFIARAAVGRVSEVIGKSGIEFDRAQRRKGMGIGVEATTKALLADPLMAPLVNAYADGVNQYIASLGYRDLPIEYKLLDHLPQKWSAERSACIQEYMVENLSGWDRDVEDSHSYALFGAQLHELLFPVRPPGVVPTVPTDSVWPFVPVHIEAPSAYDPGKGYSTDAFRSDPTNGSNNWAVHGSRTRSGAPLLANDTHLGLNFPSIWIPMQLSTPQNRVFGFALPGACGVVMGHNEHAAFGVTNAPRDTRDWYHITYKDKSHSSYLHGDEWLPVEYRIETYRVRNEKDLIDTIRVTIHGPVMFDENYGDAEPRKHLALRWMGHEASLTQKALYLMNHVRNYDDHVEALRYFSTPAQNWVFASIEGDIGMRVQGTFPNKWKDQGRYVLDGSDPAHLWRGYVPYEHNAYQKNPARGFVSSANQHSVDEQYPYWFYNAHLEYYRNRSVNNELERSENFTVEDMQRMQHSGHDLRALEGIAAMVPLLDSTSLKANERETLALLLRWDGNAKHDREEAALFQIWFDSLRTIYWSPLQKHQLPLGEPTPYNTIRILADGSLRAKVDSLLGMNAATEVRNAFAAMVKQRTTDGPLLWGDLNNARVTHLARLPAFSKEKIAVDGCGTAINAQRGNHGPSQRLVVELSDPPVAWYQLPGGISGNPGSRHYDDMLSRWNTSEYTPVLFLRSVNEGLGLGHHCTTLRP